MSRPETLLLNSRQAKVKHVTSGPPKLGLLIQETTEFLPCAKVRIPQKGVGFVLSLLWANASRDEEEKLAQGEALRGG